MSAESSIDRASSNADAKESGSAKLALGLIFGGSLIMGAILFAQYSRTMSYIKHTLDEPRDGHIWSAQAHSPEDCIDATLDWASQCEGVKTLCDMYVERVMVLCLDSLDRSEYCEAIDGISTTTAFGLQECNARNTARHVDREACSTAYRTIDGYCDGIRMNLRNYGVARPEEGATPLARPSEQDEVSP